MWELYFSRRREHVCSFWDYNYVGTSKELYPEWNSRFINFVPFLCSLTLEIVDILCDICCLESSSLLLFQQSREKNVQVSIDLSLFKHVGIHHFNKTKSSLQTLDSLGLPLKGKDKSVTLSVERMHPSNSKKRYLFGKIFLNNFSMHSIDSSVIILNCLGKLHQKPPRVTNSVFKKVISPTFKC